MIQSRLKGTGVALVTPFNSLHEIDYAQLGKLIDFCIEGGVEYLVSLGTTGESVSLSKSEKAAVLKFTVEHNAGRVAVVAGFGGNNTAQVIEDIEQADLNGVDAILSVSPYYNKPTQDGIYAHYKAVASASPKPIILYNVPGRTGSNIKAETTLRLANEVPNVIGIKEASGDFSQCMNLAKNKPENFLLISGDDNITLGLIAYGFDGVISVVGQAFPKIFSEMVRQSLMGDFTTARNLHYKLNDITDMLFAEGNPGGVKYVLELQKVCGSEMRLPLVSISDELKNKIRNEFKKINSGTID
jgi:4-hydroxy-tetrahydrodipicolinate synthase